MIDNGRRYFSPAWIKRRIELLAYLKLNQLHLHFSDNEGFRIESESHPEVVSEQHLTKRQVREIVAFARRRHVRVIPELDMPGHLRSRARRPPGAAAARLDRRARHLAARRAPLLPRADPRVPRPVRRPLLARRRRRVSGATGAAYVDFINWIDRLVRARGRTLRIWHDGLSGERPEPRRGRRVVGRPRRADAEPAAARRGTAS